MPNRSTLAPPQTARRAATAAGSEAPRGAGELSLDAIRQLTCDELVELIRGEGLRSLLTAEQRERLPLYDRETLERLAHLARRCGARPSR